tara:strand:- start:942 stop:1124 length:183 start_codon:yes stop_codon:yes gene_type:complete
MTTMETGIEIIKGLKGLIEKSRSNNKLKKKVNIEGAYSELETSIAAGVIKITKHKKKSSK